MRLPQVQVGYKKHCWWDIQSRSRVRVCTTGTSWNLVMFCVPHTLPSPTLFLNFHLCAPGLSSQTLSILPVLSLPLTGPSQLINRFIVLWLTCINSLDGTLTLCYTCCQIFLQFVSILAMVFWYPKICSLVLISFETLHTSKDDINVHSCFILVFWLTVFTFRRTIFLAF